jgi:hypothetical protein
VTRFYNAVVVPTVNLGIRWASRAGLLLGSVWLLLIVLWWAR